MTSRVLSAFFFVSLVLSITADPTGLKLRITNRALDVLKDLGLEFLQTLVNHPFADFDIPGTRTTTIKGLRFTHLSVNPAQTAVRLQPNSGLQFEINMDFSGQFDRSLYAHFIQKHHVSTKTFLFSGRGVNIKIGVKLKRTPQGRLNVKIPTCEVNADDIELRGIWDKLKPLYKLFFNNKLCPAVQRYAVPQINAMLKRFTMTTKLHESYNIDYHLSSDITVTSCCLDVPFRGVIFRKGETVDLNSIKSHVDPVFNESNRMAYVGISEFFFNSIAMSLQKAGPFKFTIPELPSPAGTVLGTVGLSTLPSPAETALSTVGLSTGPIKVKLTEPPTVRISKDGVSATVNVGVKSLAEPADKKPTVPVNCKVDINGTRLILLSTNPVQCKVKAQTFAGRLAAPLINIGINNYITKTLKTMIEGLLIPLPEGVSFTEEKIEYHDGFMVIGGNLNFTPAGRRKVVKGIGR